MALTDTVKVQLVYTETVNSQPQTTLGLEERKTLAELLALMNTGATTVGAATPVITQTAPAAAPVPFADLTAAANYVNSLRTLLIAARVLK